MRAVRTLETPGLAARLSAVAGAPLDMISRSLPAPVTDAVSRATEGAMRTALRVALATLPEAEKTIVPASAAGATAVPVLDDLPVPAASTAGERFARFLPTGDFGHKAMAALSGAVGGAFGIATLPVELPVSTTLMLRSIAQIAREEGEDLSDPENALACVQVFALGGRSGAETALTESGYFAVRAALAKTMSEAARYAGNRALLDEAAPALIRFSTQIAARFGLVVSQKVAAQAVPILGAVGGGREHRLHEPFPGDGTRPFYCAPPGTDLWQGRGARRLYRREGAARGLKSPATGPDSAPSGGRRRGGRSGPRRLPAFRAWSTSSSRTGRNAHAPACPARTAAGTERR